MPALLPCVGVCGFRGLGDGHRRGVFLMSEVPVHTLYPANLATSAWRAVAFFAAAAAPPSSSTNRFSSCVPGLGFQNNHLAEM